MKRATLHRLLRAVPALLLLHALLVFPYAWEPVAAAQAWLRPSPDLAFLLVIGVLGALWCGDSPWLARGLAALALVVPVYRFGATVVPAFYGKDFDPWHDVLLVPGLVHLLTHRLASWQVWAVWLALSAGAAVVFLLVAQAFRAVLVIGADRGWALATLALCSLVVVTAALDRPAGATPGRLTREGMLARPVTDGARLWRARGWRVEEAFAERAAAARSELAHAPRDLARLEGADVHLLWIESYGRVIHEPPLRPRFARLAAELEAAAARAGLAACSGYLRPSIRGGLSSLAHAELLTGVPVENRRILDCLLASELVPLPRIFAAAGYLTVDVQPAMTGVWPAGAFFGFARRLFQESLPYRGRSYHFGRMPDQFALDVLRREVLAHAEHPVFSQFVSVTSHAPFSMVPRYHEDWNALALAGADEPERVRPIDWTNYTRHPEVEEAFLECIRYALRVSVGFAAGIRRPALVIIAGDHQPPGIGPVTRDEWSFDVPVHVLAAKAELLAPFRAQGFAPGWLPPEAAQSTPSHQFLGRFLRAFGSATPTPR